MGRLRKAEEFLASAQTLEAATGNPDGVDSYVQLCVLAGIAAADVICCAKLGFHSKGQDHGSAVALLKTVHSPSARNLRVLLGMKTRSGYGPAISAVDDKKRAGRAATALVEEARKY